MANNVVVVVVLSSYSATLSNRPINRWNRGTCGQSTQLVPDSRAFAFSDSGGSLFSPWFANHGSWRWPNTLPRLSIIRARAPTTTTTTTITIYSLAQRYMARPYIRRSEIWIRGTIQSRRLDQDWPRRTSRARCCTRSITTCKNDYPAAGS